jgi:DNA polymerase IV
VRTIFLLDIDCFFASVEMALHPELRGKPLCIGGRRPSRRHVGGTGGERGIVVCPNYEARAYGVRTAMPLRMAEQLLPPEAVFLPGNHRLYGEYSERVMNILHDFTPDIEQVSVDEAYMDVSGCLHLWGHHPRRMAEMMKERIRRECGLGVSIGVASNKVCAKIAAGLKKPDGLVIVPHGQERAFLAPLPIEVVPGVGKKTLPKLHAQGIFTVADVQTHTAFAMNWIGRYLTGVANGEDKRVVREDTVEKSISRDTTFGNDTNDLPFIAATLYYLTERCCKTLRKRNQVAFTVTVKVRFADFTTIQKQVTLHDATANEEEVFPPARQMLDNLLPQHRSVRLVGVKVSKILSADHLQMRFDATKSEQRERLHRRLDTLQAKHGYRSIQWGITIT